MFWARYEVLWWAIFGQAIIAWLLIRTGITHFNREELLGRELDTINLQWAWQVFRDAFWREKATPWKWWRRNVWGIVKEMKWAILLALLISAGAVFVGITQAEIFSIPAGLLNFGNLEEGLVTGIEDFGPIRFFSVKGLGSIFFHNLRAIALDSFTGHLFLWCAGYHHPDSALQHHWIFCSHRGPDRHITLDYFWLDLYCRMVSLRYLQLS